MPNPNNGTRLDALEHSHANLHSKMDQVITALGGNSDAGATIVPGTFDAYGRPVVAMMNPHATTNPSENAQTLKMLLPLLQRAQKPAPTIDWTPIMVALLPVLVERLMERPDPIEQMAALRDIMQPDMTEQMMGLLGPMVMAKMGGAPGGPAAADQGEMQSAIAAALQGVDPTALAAFAASQTPTNGETRPS